MFLNNKTCLEKSKRSKATGTALEEKLEGGASWEPCISRETGIGSSDSIFELMMRRRMHKTCCSNA